MQPPQVFVIAPFDAEGRRVRDTVQRAIQDAGFGVFQYRDDLFPGAQLAASVLDGIRRADLVIADLSRQNPNALYELGYAHALRQRTILLHDGKPGQKLPSDLAGLDYIFYDSLTFTGLADRIQEDAKKMTAPRSI